MEASTDAGALSDELRAFLDREAVGVLATIAADGKPRQSLVYFVREILTEGVALPTARIAQRISGAAEPAQPMTDHELAALGRVLLAISIERVGAASYIGR